MVVLFGASMVFALGCGDSDDPKAMGEDCAADSECADGKCHVGICVSPTPVANGAACTSNAECKSFNCVSGKCAAGATKKDAACLNNDECASNFCDKGKCSLKVNGKDCADGKECSGGACVDKKCATKCTKTAECAKGEVCHSKDMKTQFCYKPTYSADTGKRCGTDGKCGGGLTCYGSSYTADASCSKSCTKDMECPPTHFCAKAESSSGTVQYCQPRSYCSPCADDSWCPTGFKCASMSGGKFCTTACTKGGADCPMFAKCKDDDKGNPVCQNKNGKCIGDGTDCAPCKSDTDCKKGSICFNINLSYEQYCSTNCTNGASCGNSTTCMTVSQSTGRKQCMPAGSGTPKWYTCGGSALTHPVYKVGDIFPDFEMVGLVDKNKNGNLLDETLGYVKLSDFAKDYKAILFNIMTFW